MAASLQHIRSTDSGRFNFYQDLVVFRRWNFSLSESEDIRRSEPRNLNHIHELFGGHVWNLTQGREKNQSETGEGTLVERCLACEAVRSEPWRGAA
jgi:hypothetical protein